MSVTEDLNVCVKVLLLFPPYKHKSHACCHQLLRYHMTKNLIQSSKSVCHTGVNWLVKFPCYHSFKVFFVIEAYFFGQFHISWNSYYLKNKKPWYVDFSERNEQKKPALLYYLLLKLAGIQNDKSTIRGFWL